MVINLSPWTLLLFWKCLSVYLQPLDGLFSARRGHDALLDAWNGLQPCLAAQRAWGRRGCQAAHRCCGEMARPLVLWGKQVSMLIVVYIFQVWATEERQTTQRGRSKSGGGRNVRESTRDRQTEKGRKRTKRRKDQCETHSSHQRITTNTPVRCTVFTSGCSKES